MTRFSQLSYWNKAKNLAAGTVFVACVVGFIGSVWVVMSFFEARAYNKVTGAQVSTYDAMFIQLRVQAPADCK